MTSNDPQIGPALERARSLLDSPPDPSGPSRLPRLARAYRKFVNRGLADHDHQVNLRLNAVLDAVLAESRAVGRMAPDQVWQRIDALGHHVEDLYKVLTRMDAQSTAHSGAVNELRAKFAALRDEVGQLHNALTGVDSAAMRRLDAFEAHMVALQADVGARLDATSADVDRLNDENVARPFTSDPDVLRLRDQHGVTRMGYSAESLPRHAQYADFEDIFRGPVRMIAARLKPYLPYLADVGEVLDIGCGRGELLELLRAEGIAARGIDPDPSMVGRCRDLGLDVEETDGVAALRGVPPQSLGAVVSIQVVEHVELPTLRELFELSLRSLRPGGVMIAETVNPHSPMALKAFWLDLTHVRPLYPEALLLLARELGFTSAHIVFPAGTGDLDDDLRTRGEYAIVARKD